MSTPDTLTRELAALDDALAGRPVDPDMADLGELALLLRDDRPVTDDAFARALDLKAERGFPRERAKTRRFGIRLPRIPMPALGLAASLVLVVGVTGVVLSQQDDTSPQASLEASGTVDSPGRDGSSSGGGSAPAPGGRERSSSADDGGAGTPASKQATPGSDEAVGTGSEPAPGTSSPTVIGPLPPAPSNPNADRRQRREVERSAELALAAPRGEIDTAAAGILRVTGQVGGYVVSSTVSSNTGGQFELRVPEPRLADALTRLSRVADVRRRTQSAQDITGEVVSVRERLTDARTERSSLLRQLAKADTTNETASIRARLRLVSGQIAAAKRDLRRVQTRASYSSIAVSLTAERRGAGSGDDDGAWTPVDALRDAVRILEVAAGVLLIALAIIVPLGLLAVPAWLATRHAGQRRRERALDAV
jgi:hypothetical protein